MIFLFGCFFVDAWFIFYSVQLHLKVWTLTMSINNPHLFDWKDGAAGSWQNYTQQLERKDCIQTYITVIYSGFILDKYS